jgi:hypothetical protein
LQLQKVDGSSSGTFWQPNHFSLKLLHELQTTCDSVRRVLNKETTMRNVMFIGEQLILSLDAQPLRKSPSSSSSSESEITIA